MGHQQILFLLLGICIIGVITSVGVITLQDELAPDNREVLMHQLQSVAFEAQAYYRRPFNAGGGEETFLGLSANIEGIKKLTLSHSTSYGDIFIRTSGNVKSVELMAIGIERGQDERYPVRVVMTVWPESTAVKILN
ncbi:MAG: hypothetical protein ACKVRP_07040 [Bacteroidota bacterium]